MRKSRGSIKFSPDGNRAWRAWPSIPLEKLPNGEWTLAPNQCNFYASGLADVLQVVRDLNAGRIVQTPENTTERPGE